MAKGVPPVYPEFAAGIARTGRTYTDIAEAVGKHPYTISRILEGTLRPSAELRKRLTEEIGETDPDFVFQLSPELQRLMDQVAEQGLPAAIEDPYTLHRIATLCANDRRSRVRDRSQT